MYCPVRSTVMGEKSAGGARVAAADDDADDDDADDDDDDDGAGFGASVCGAVLLRRWLLEVELKARCCTAASRAEGRTGGHGDETNCRAAMAAVGGRTFGRRLT
jgi:hypothetical protein